MDITQDPNRPDVFVMLASRQMVVIRDRHDPMLVHVRPKPPILGIRYWAKGVRLPDAEGQALVRAAFARYV